MPTSLSNDPFSNVPDSSIRTTKSHVSDDQSQTTAPSVSSKDSQEVLLGEEMGTRLAAILESFPQLEVPKTSTLSIANFFNTMSDVTRAFRDQLSSSERVDQESRRRASYIAMEQAEDLLELYEKRNEAIARITEEAKQAMIELQKYFEEMQKLAEEQQKWIDKINAGHPEEKQRYQELAAAYDSYLEQLREIGVVDQGNGNFFVPEEAKDQFNYLTQQYQLGVDKFNEYWEGRSNDINEYNSITIDYNKSVVEYNKLVSEFIDRYNLSNYMRDNNLTIPVLKEADLYDISGYRNRFDAPSLITTPPATISIPPLPGYVRSGSPPPVPLDPFPTYNMDAIFTGVYSTLYELNVSPIDQEIKASPSYFWPFINKQLIAWAEEAIPDPILNHKPLAHKILPASVMDPRPTLTSNTKETSLLAMQEIGVSRHLEVILGQGLLKQLIESLDLEALQNLDNENKEKRVQELIDRILLLSVGLLGNQSLQALFPGFSLIADSLSSLPKDSPAFAILFAVSLANRIQENAIQEISTEVVQKFLKEIPEFATLSSVDQKKLAAVLILGQLLIAGKLLEENLGLPGLLVQILPSLSPDLDIAALLSQVKQEGEQGLTQLHNTLLAHFIDQDYPQDKAQFLAQIGVNLVEQGLSTPTVTSIISPQTLNVPLLIDSIKAGLILTHDYPLTQAEAIANEAVDLTLLETPYPSTQQFRTTLDSHLKDLGVPHSIDIATQAILIPVKEKALTPSIPLPPIPPILPIPPSASPRVPPATATITPATESESLSAPGIPPIAPPIPPKTPVMEKPSIPPVPPSPVPPKSSPVDQPDLIAPTTPPIPSPLLSPAKLMALLEKRTLQLLTPQLGPQLAKQVTEEIGKTLFGTVQLGKIGEIADIQSPYSLVNAIKKQIVQLHVQSKQTDKNQAEHNRELATHMHELFSDTIKPMIDFYAFSLKLMDPAYLFILSANAGIIYSDHGKKKIDIPV